MYTYLDYLAEEKVRSYNALGILFIFIVVPLFLIIIMLNQRDLHSNNFLIGEVSQIKLDTIQRKSEATFSNHYVKVPILEISVDNTKFTLKPKYGEYREKLLKELKLLDTVKVYFKKETKNQLMPLQIERNDEVLFPYSFFLNQGSKAIKIAITVFLIALSLSLIIIFKRLKIVRKNRDTDFRNIS